MQLKTFILGGSSVLFVSLALAGCNGSGGNAGGAGTSGVAGVGTGGGSSSDALATVGGTPVTRGQLTNLLEGLAGPRVLPELIDEQLLSEALKAKGGSVSDAELSAELARLGERDPSLKAAVDAGGARAEVPRLQARRSLTVQKLLTAGIDAKDADVQAFFKKFESYYDTPAQIKLGLLVASTKTRADQLARSLATKPDSFAALVAEQKSKSATDPAAAQSSPDTGQFQPVEAPSGPPSAATKFNQLLLAAKKGGILPIQSASPQGPFLIARVIDRKDAVKADFSKIKDQVTTDYKLGQAATAEIKKGPSNPGTLEQNVKQVVGFLAQPNPQTRQPGIKATLRDALTYILQQASQKLLSGLRTNGTVQISDATYKDVAAEYVAAPTGAGTTGSATTGSPAAPTGNAAAPGASPATPTGNDAASATTSGAANGNSAAGATTPAAGAGTSNAATTNAAATAKP